MEQQPPQGTEEPPKLEEPPKPENPPPNIPATGGESKEIPPPPPPVPASPVSSEEPAKAENPPPAVPATTEGGEADKEKPTPPPAAETPPKADNPPPNVPASTEGEPKEKAQSVDEAATAASADKDEPKSDAAAARPRRSLFQHSADASISSAGKCPCEQCDKVGCRCCAEGKGVVASAETWLRKGFAMKAVTENSAIAPDLEKTQAEIRDSWDSSPSKKKKQCSRRTGCSFSASNIALCGLIAFCVGVIAVVAVKRARTAK